MGYGADIRMGKRVTAGTAPSVATGAQAASASMGTGADDAQGTISVTSIASGNGAGALCTVTFSTAFTNAPAVIAQVNGTLGLRVQASSVSTTGFTVTAIGVPVANTAYVISYIVMGQTT